MQADPLTGSTVTQNFGEAWADYFFGGLNGVLPDEPCCSEALYDETCFALSAAFGFFFSFVCLIWPLAMTELPL
jgi:hypothetical protein